MIFAGIDIGSSRAKAIILNDSKIITKINEPITLDSESAAKAIMDKALKESGLLKDQVTRIGATGVGGRNITWADGTYPELVCHGKGAHWYYPSARSVINIGAESYSVGKLDKQGGLIDFARNDKCAAGTGIFIEEMAHALEVDLEDMGPLSMKSESDISISATCTVFAESEVVSLMMKHPKEDVVKAILSSIAFRVSSLTKRIDLEDDVVLSGGCGNNAHIPRLLEEKMGHDILIPDNPVTVGALGAAILAQE